MTTIRGGLSLFLVVAAVFGAVIDSDAHGLVGKRFFPATLTIDDPFVADELSLPTVSRFRTPSSGESPATWETDVAAELQKRLTPDLGLSLAGNLKILNPDEGKSVSGFDNLEVALKYVFFKDEEHETLLSLGLSWDVGGTGSRKKVGAEHFDTVTPTLFFGKGFGDLPESVEFLKPVAVTAAVGFAIPTRGTTITHIVTDEGENAVLREANPNVVKWGGSVQYSLQYLQAFVRDVGLPKPISRMIPIVEFAMQTPADGRLAGRTTGTINPGIIWFGRYIQLGLEALLPVNDRTSKNVGIIGQVHFYLDDIAPQIFTWTPFHGVLGPTQPR
jgi:hypothetical protein